MLPICILVIEDENDRKFMADLFIQYHRLMYGTIRSIVKSDIDAEDVLQSTVEKLIDKIPTLKELNQAKRINYIVSACKNTARNANRDQARHRTWSYENEITEQASDVEISEDVIRQIEMESLQRIWPLLDERSRYLLEAKYLLELDNCQIAKDLGISPNSVRTYLVRARKTAYDLIEKHN